MQISTYRSTIVAIFVSLALAGCDRNQSQTPQQSTINQTPSAHSQTKALRAASAVGYDGKQLLLIFAVLISVLATIAAQLAW